jgi:hypothetical protein
MLSRLDYNADSGNDIAGLPLLESPPVLSLVLTTPLGIYIGNAVMDIPLECHHYHYYHACNRH